LVAACGGQSARGTTNAQPTPSTTTQGTTTPPTPAPRVGAGSRARRAAGDWLTFNYDAQRDGVGPAFTGITRANLGSLGRTVVHLDGTVDSVPVELHAIRVRGATRDVFVVTTSYGKTIAIDARTGRRLWEFTPSTIGDYVRTAQVTTASPTADPDRRFVYAASPDGRIHKLALASGGEVTSGRWPVLLTFDPTKEKLPSALNISGRNLIVTTGGYYGDAQPYQGHVVTIDRGTGAIANVYNTLCSDRHRLIVPSSCGASDSAVWAREGAVVEPGTGNLLVATGNAPFNGSTNWGDSVLELSPDASRLLQNWTPTNQADLGPSDTDLGSTAPAVLPPFHGRRLVVQGGKAGVFDLLDLARLNGSGGHSARTGGELQELPEPGGAPVFSAPAVWSHGGRTFMFVANGSGTAAYVLRGTATAPRLIVLWQHGTPGTSPVLAGGLLYVYDEMNGALVVRDPVSGLALRSLPAATGHWNSPIVVGGRIVLPTGNYMDHSSSGQLIIWHAPGA
jgi:outer membrane protein assembly factor BamB